MIHTPQGIISLQDLHDLEEKLERAAMSRPALRKLLDSMPDEYKRDYTQPQGHPASTSEPDPIAR